MDFLEIIENKRVKVYKFTFLYVFGNNKDPKKNLEAFVEIENEFTLFLNQFDG